jgi:hypothetical protein
MIMHKHHLIPRHAGGTDDKSNIIKVNIAMHAFLHKMLYEEHGRWQDEVAYKNLAGVISNQDAIQEARIKANIGNKHREGKSKSLEEREKISNSLKGYKRSEESKKKQSQTISGRTLPQEQVAKIAAKNTGKKRSEETKEKMRQAWLRRKSNR